MRSFFETGRGEAVPLKGAFCCRLVDFLARVSIVALMLVWILAPGAVSAAEKPLVGWSSDVLAMDDHNPLLDAPGVRARIARAVTAKLAALDMDGRLPFRLQEASTDYGNHVMSGDDPIGLIPLSTLDTTFDSEYHVNGKTYYRSIVFSGLSLAICSADPESRSWRILACIPLNGYDIIGGDTRSLRSSPITLQEKADKFAEISARMINQYLDFSKDRSVFKDAQVRALMPETYQVTDVAITSPMAQRVFAGRETEIKEIIGAFFTSSYQRKTRRIVYPPKGGGQWKQDVTSSLYTFQANVPSGEVRLSMEQPRHPIRLELSGLAKQEMDTGKGSAVVRDVFYKAWLKKSPVEGREKSEMADHTVRREIKTGNAWVEYDQADVFTELIIDTAENLGAQKR